MEERGRLEKLGYPTDAKRCYQQASQLYEEALELRKKHLGVAHRDTLASLDHLGSFYLGDPFHPEWIYQPEKILQLWTEAWRLRSASLGEKHPETLRSLDNLAYILLDPQRLNRPAEGLPLLEKAYRYRAETLGASNWVTLDRLDQLTETYLRLGRPADAVPLLENAVTRALTAGKRGVPVDLPSLSALVQSYFALGRDGQALALLARVLNQRTQTLGEKHLATLESMRDLAETYLESDRPKEAVPLLELMTKVLIDLLNERQANPISSIDQLPVIEKLVDMPPLKVTLKTEFNFNEAVHLYGMIPRHLANLAACYLLLGRPDEASPLIEKLQQPYKLPGSAVEFTWAAHPPSNTRTVLDQVKSDRNIGKSEPVILSRLKELADISLQQTVILLEHFVNIAEELLYLHYRTYRVLAASHRTVTLPYPKLSYLCGLNISIWKS